jgi:hypothetical protein
MMMMMMISFKFLFNDGDSNNNDHSFKIILSFFNLCELAIKLCCFAALKQ